MKKWVSVVVLLILSVTLLAACGGNNNAGGNNEPAKTPEASPSADAQETKEPEQSKVEGKVVFLTNRTDMVDTEYVKYKEQFEAKYPGVELEFEAIQDYDQQLKIRMASGEFPDVVLIPTIPNNELSKYFAPLDDLNLGDIYFADYKKVDGSMYGVTTGGNSAGIVYNKKAFEAAGITEVPTTLDAFMEASEKLKSQGIVPLASNFKDAWPLYPWQSDVPALIAGSPTVNNDRAMSDAPFEMDGPYGKAFTILRDMHEKGYLEPDITSTNWEQSKKDLATGKTAMFLLGNWVIPQIIENGAASEDIGFFPFPADNSGELKAMLGPDWFFAVNKNSKSVDAAKAFVKWMIEESGYANYAGFIPVLKSQEPTLPQLNEFNAFDPTYLETEPDDSNRVAIVNKAQIDDNAVIQEFVLSKNPQEVLEKYNKQWADAKKALGL